MEPSLSFKNKCRFAAIVVLGGNIHVKTLKKQNDVKMIPTIEFVHVYEKSMINKVGAFVSTLCSIEPTKSNKTIEHIHNLTSLYLSRNYETVLIGQGYGGMCVSRIAELYNFCPDPRLQIVSLGSIYIPDKENTNRVNIRHYMFDNDIVALACNKLSKVSKLSMQSDKVTWLTNEYTDNAFNAFISTKLHGHF